MKKADSELEIVQLWREWPRRNDPPGPMKGMLFYTWVQQNYPHVLEFKFSGSDQWQVISGWLNKHRLK